MKKQLKKLLNKIKQNKSRIVVALLFAGALTLGSLALTTDNKEVVKLKTPQELRHSVVKLTEMSGKSGGTGFAVINPNTGQPTLISNAHVCAISKNGKLIASNNYGAAVVSVKHISKKYDVCELDALGLPALTITTHAMEYGEVVAAIGHGLLEPAALSIGGYVGEAPATVGRISVDGCKEDEETLDALFFIVCTKTFQLAGTTTVIYPGNSGSPALDRVGDVVGIFNAGNSETNRGMYVPSRYIVEFLKTGE